MSNQKLIFLHLPKCGGTTFHKILERFYPQEEIFDIRQIDPVTFNIEDFKPLPRHEKNTIKLLKGHMVFGLHEYFAEEAKYITFLRDPLERIISYYYYVKRTPSNKLYQKGLFNEATSLLDFVKNIDSPDIHNAQIRMISGINDSEELMLEKALDNIEKKFSFVGTVEKFDESLILMQKMYNWPLPYYTISNNTVNRPKITSVEADILKLIEEKNKGDIALHNAISSQLERQITDCKNMNMKMFRLKAYSKLLYYKKEVKTLLK